MFGGQPSKGGSPTGSTHNSIAIDHNLTEYFFLFKDSEFSLPGYLLIPYHSQITSIFKAFIPKRHAFLSSRNLSRSLLDVNSNISNLLGVIGAVSSPTLRFRFSNIDHQKFKNDEQYEGCAYKTQEVVEAWRLGLVGSFFTGLNSDWFSRAKDNPSKILTGIAQLSASAALIMLERSHFKGKLPFVIAGALLA